MNDENLHKKDSSLRSPQLSGRSTRRPLTSISSSTTCAALWEFRRCWPTTKRSASRRCCTLCAGIPN